MKHVGMFEAKTKLSALVEEVENGGQVVITRHGKPVVELVRAVPKLTPEQIEERRKAIEGLRSLSRKINLKATPEEIKSWINEGRR
jgi:prevent-host-death family protein